MKTQDIISNTSINIVFVKRDVTNITAHWILRLPDHETIQLIPRENTGVKTIELYYAGFHNLSWVHLPRYFARFTREDGTVVVFELLPRKSYNFGIRSEVYDLYLLNEQSYASEDLLKIELNIHERIDTITV